MRATPLLAIAALVLAPFCGAGSHAESREARTAADDPQRGALASDAPPTLYNSDPNHIANRLFASLYVRKSNLPERPGGTPIPRYEGGDVLEFPAWANTGYYSEPQTAARIEGLLREFLTVDAAQLPQVPLKRVLLQHDLWAAHDHLVQQNIAWQGTREERDRRSRLAALLARAIRRLAPTRKEIEALPETYDEAARSPAFAPAHAWDRSVDYLPPDLFSQEGPWIEMDFFRPNIHEDIEGRFITLHTRHFRGRSYFRVFYRFPGGRASLDPYLAYVEQEGIDWKFAAQHGFIRLKEKLKQIPAGTEVALVQFLIALDDELKPVPTEVVQSVRLRTFKNTDGATDPDTDSARGMNVYEYVMRRKLLFNGLKNGGLEREPNDLHQYRQVFLGPTSPDWGPKGRQETVAAQCIGCHTTQGPGAYTLVTLTNQGGFDAGAMMGVAFALPSGAPSPRPARAIRWKTRDETYRRLVEAVEGSSAADAAKPTR